MFKERVVSFQPPVGQTCGEFTKPFFEFGTGYIANPDATADCAYCQYKVGDEYLARINASFSYLWRNFGFI
ncbi:ASG_G0047570.mRNA.1.CDS.1 [Saccharomyces cerevisiae]|nr:ASG_G0047570.mRNA.1.CDS.1 [Saccharomyces cerevisiae]CAI7320691.1 ASG_G0047570.mRNA.1.CDS.1 [Saccharomyces cerevisiae]